MYTVHALYGLLYVSVIFKVVYTAVGIQPPVPKPPGYEDQEGCYSPQLNKVLPYNVPYSPQDGKSCEQYECGTDNNIRIESCGALGPGTDCYIVPGNLSEPYPKCCDDIACNPPSMTTASAVAYAYANA